MVVLSANETLFLVIAMGHAKITLPIMKGVIFMSSFTTRIEVAKLIWEIAGKSAEHRNAVIDVIGEDAYKNVMKLQKENPLFAVFKEES